MNAVELADVSYTYDDGTVALKNVTLTVEKGRTIVLIGPNGAGKTTLLQIIAGLMHPTKGLVKILGLELNKKTINKIRRKIGLLFQDPDDQIFMPKVWDDIAFGPINIGLNETEVRAKVQEAVGTVGIENLSDRIAHHLSYGEKKRVAIAGVLAVEPEILILDEPTLGLDPWARKDFIEFLKSKLKGKHTIIIASHDLDLINISDKTYLIQEGKFEKEIESACEVL